MSLPHPLSSRRACGSCEIVRRAHSETASRVPWYDSDHLGSFPKLQEGLSFPLFLLLSDLKQPPPLQTLAPTPHRIGRRRPTKDPFRSNDIFGHLHSEGGEDKENEMPERQKQQRRQRVYRAQHQLDIMNPEVSPVKVCSSVFFPQMRHRAVHPTPPPFVRPFILSFLSLCSISSLQRWNGRRERLRPVACVSSRILTRSRLLRCPVRSAELY